MKSSFLFIRLCVLISILASGTLIFLLLRAIYYPQLSILLLLTILLCHLLTTEYKKTHPATIEKVSSTASPSVPTEVKKALAEALGGIMTLVSNEKTKLTVSEKKLLVSERESLLTIAHFLESIESMRSQSMSSLEHPYETTSLRETVVHIVDSRRTAFLKKGIVLLYKAGQFQNDYIAIDQKHLRRIIETLLKSVIERGVRGRLTLTHTESVTAGTISVTLKLIEKAKESIEPKEGLKDAQYTTLQRLVEQYGGTISFNTPRIAVWTSCTCTFPSLH